MKTQIHLLKNLVLTTLALLAVLPMQAQNVGDAIYIYRNDGEFNAFYREEIDSMAYSYYDVDSVRYEEIVTQLIYTEDSIYHIPIAVIDSVSFVPPVNEYQPNVVKIDNLIPYVESVEGMKLCLSSDVPSNLLPKTGDVLIYESFENEMFPMGFAGEVKETKPSYVLCDSVSFEDIYKKYVCFGTYVAIGDEGTEEGKVRLVPRRRIEGKLSSSITINEHFGTEGSGLFGTTSIKMGFDLRIEFKFEVGKPAFFDLSVQPEIKSRVEAGIKGKFNLMDLFPHKPNLLCVPIPNTLFLLKLKGGPLVSFIIEASATVSAETSMGFKAGLKYSNEKWKTYKKKTSKGFSTPTITGYMSGTLFAGLQTEFGIFSYGDIISASIIKEVGGEMLIRLEENLLNTNKYDELKKATTDLNLKATVGAKAGLKLAKWYQITPRVDLLSLKIPLNSWPIVPEFSNLSWSPDKSGYKGTLKGNVSGNLLFPVTLGWALYDKKDNLYKTMYFPATYRKIEDWQQNGIEYALEENLPYGAHYKAYPLVKLFDAVMRADQYVEINADAFVETGAASDITCSEATLAGKAEGLEYGQDVDAGVAYTLNQNSDKWTNVSANRREDGSYTVKVSNLQSDQTYYYRAYAYVDGKYYYGETKSFKTEKELAVSTLAASGVTENSAVVSGQLENYKAERLTAYGIAYGTSSGNMQKMAAGNLSADGVFSISLTELQDDTKYFYHAYGVQDGKEYVGETKSFATEKKEQEDPDDPDDPNNPDNPDDPDNPNNPDDFEELLTHLCPDSNHPHMIDLGLPSGTKWACCNVGANKPEDSGGYYFWGETEEKEIHSGLYYSYFQYVITEEDGLQILATSLGKDIAGTGFDVAHVKWGGSWRMPTRDQSEELWDMISEGNLSESEVSLNGVKGMVIKSQNNNGIFLPYSGAYPLENYETFPLQGYGKKGYYWTSTRCSEGGNEAYNELFAYIINLSNTPFVNIDFKANGIPVRPVSK